MNLNIRQKEENKKLEHKETIKIKRLKSVLSDWLDSLNNSQDFELEVKGNRCRIPYKAVKKGEINLEIEHKEGENEFELELKWKGSSQDIIVKQ